MLAGSGKHVSAGRDIDTLYERKAGLWWGTSASEAAKACCRRAGGMWVCADVGASCLSRQSRRTGILCGRRVDGGLVVRLAIASHDSYTNWVVSISMPGGACFAHPSAMDPGLAKEFLFFSERMTSDRALEPAMINRVVARADVESRVASLAERNARMPYLRFALTKKATDQATDLTGLQTGIDSVFGLHHFAQTHDAEVGADSLDGYNARLGLSRITPAIRATPATCVPTANS